MSAPLPESIELRLGDWMDVLKDVKRADAIITDTPFSKRTHAGHNRRRGKQATGRELSYAHWGPWDVVEFVDAWAPRCDGWFCSMTSHDLVPAWEAAFDRHGWFPFAPVPVVYPGSVRKCGDGPASATVWLVARPRRREFMGWGSVQGFYKAGRATGGHIGGKTIELMRQVVGDYTEPGMRVVDPCAGYGTTLAAAAELGCTAIGAEVVSGTFADAIDELAKGYTPLPHPRANRQLAKAYTAAQGALW